MKNKFDLTKALIIVCSFICLAIAAYWMTILIRWTFAVFSVSLIVLAVSWCNTINK